MALKSHEDARIHHISTHTHTHTHTHTLDDDDDDKNNHKDLFSANPVKLLSALYNDTLRQREKT